VSLVEKALKKMERARAATAPAAAAPVRRAEEPKPEVRSQAPPPALARTDKLITVNLRALRDSGILPTEQSERRVAAEFRQIKRPLVAAMRGRGVPALPNGRALMVASALPGEGKTFTSINLSLSLALEKDTTVVLVDGDLAKAHLSRIFDVRDEPGLMDVLEDGSRDVASVIIPTTVPGLSILPAGRGSQTATELLASARMESIVADLLARDPTRIVVFDSPPLLLTTESRALTSVAGQVVVVVRAEDTTHSAVLEAIKHVAQGKPVGLVLNQCRARATHGYYNYGEYGDSADSH
jgi:protein-tyrosine kinase